VIGSASADRSVNRGGHLVYGMRVTEVMTFDEYSADPRFESKKPLRNGSRKQSCGDNIYFRRNANSAWHQRDSFHSKDDGTIKIEHMTRDTGVNRVLISNDFIYFGGTGPEIPEELRDDGDRHLCKIGRGRLCFEDQQLIAQMEYWIRSLGSWGYQGAPFEWITLRR
jgi:hypothetical protein